MSKKIAAGGILMMVLAAGCASVESDAPRVPAHEREYTTGSNMPRRPQQGPSEVKTVDRETMERNSDRGSMPNPEGRPGRW